MYLSKLDKIRNDAAECARMRDQATDKATREVFSRLHARLKLLGDQVETSMLQRKTG